MNLNFVLNDYILIWNLLFQASISEEVQRFKQKLWKSYRHSYNKLAAEERKILKDPKNYIPDDDTIFDMVKAFDIYQTVHEQTEVYRLSLLKTWDEYKKQLSKDLKDILRFDIKLYHVLVVHPKLNITDMKVVKGKKVNTITWGRREDLTYPSEAIISLLNCIVQKELQDFQVEYKEIVQAVIELAINNELATRLYGKSVYLRGDPSLKFLKRQIYPYWLMYLGVSKAEIINYMVRDNIAFDTDKYPYEKQLASLDLLAFIEFCIKNQRHIIKISELEII